MKKLLVGIGIAAMLSWGGCQSAPQVKERGATGMVNQKCPLSGNPVGAGAPTANWHGDTVGFCCGGCLAGWDQWSDAQRDRFVAAQKS